MLLLMNRPGELEPITTWAAEDVQAHMAHMHAVRQEFIDAGVFVDGQVLAFPEQAAVVRVDESGAPVVTDGPFAEAKEFLAGFMVVEADSREHACRLAARISAAPGPGGALARLPIEVREVL